MKNNTEETKVALKKALHQIPQDNSLSEVRYHIRVALDKLENVEKKRARRELNFERRIEQKKSINPLQSIKTIDEEIAKEKYKIKEIQSKRMKGGQDDDELQTVFG